MKRNLRNSEAKQKTITSYHNTLSGIIWILSGNVFQASSQIAVFLILARLLTPRDFGIVNTAFIVIGFAQLFSTLGVGYALVQKSNLEKQHLSTGFTSSITFGLLLGSLLWFFSPVFSDFFQVQELTPILRWLALTFPLRSTSLVSESLLKRDLQFRYLAGANVISFTLGYGIVGIILAVFGFGVWALVTANIVQIFIQSIILIAIKPHPKSLLFDIHSFKELMNFGGGLTITSLFNYLALQGDYLIVGRFLGVEALGLYSRAYQLMALPATTLGQSLDQVLFPTMARVQDKPKQLGIAYRRSITVVALLILPLTVCTTILAPEIIQVLLGNNWKETIVPFQILSFGMLFRISYKICDSLIIAKGKVYQQAWRHGFYAIAVLGFAWLGHYWGIVGVAIGVLCALAVNFILLNQLSLGLTSLNWEVFLTAYIPAILLTSVTFTAVITVVKLLRDWSITGIWTLLISTVITSSIFLFVLYFAPKFPVSKELVGKDCLWMIEKSRDYLSKLKVKPKI
jgi:PST family polysaccharide transporter